MSILLTLRQNQLAVFNSVALMDFVDKMCAHLRRSFPQQMSSLDDLTLQQRVERELAIASKFGITDRQSVCSFLNLSAIYGENFIHQPDNQWMKEYLTDTAVPNPQARMHRLYEAVLAKLDVEENNQRIREKFQKIMESE